MANHSAILGPIAPHGELVDHPVIRLIDEFTASHHHAVQSNGFRCEGRNDVSFCAVKSDHPHSFDQPRLATCCHLRCTALQRRSVSTIMYSHSCGFEISMAFSYLLDLLMCPSKTNINIADILARIGFNAAEHQHFQSLNTHLRKPASFPRKSSTLGAPVSPTTTRSV